MRLVRAVDSTSRIECARAWLGGHAGSAEALVVSATPEAGADLLRGAAQGPGAAFGWQRVTLRSLASKLAAPALSEQNAVRIGQLAVEAVVARVVYEASGAARSNGSLGRYEDVAGRPGFARALARTLWELRLAQVDSAGLAKLTPELRSIYAAYDERLRDEGLADRAAVLALAVDAARGAPSPLLGLPTLLLDVAIENAAERALVEAVAARAPDLLVTVPAGDTHTLEQLSGIGLPVEALDEASDGRSLERLKCHLFEETSPPEAELDDSVFLLSAPGESRECVEIARRLLERAREGVPFDRMAILLRSPEEYRPHLEDALGRAGIPAHFARGAVQPDPAGRAFVALLACAAEGLSARRFAEYLSLGEVPDATPDGGPPEAVASTERWAPPDDELFSEVYEALAEASAEAEEERHADPGTQPVTAGTLRAPRRWERLVNDAAVIGGRDRWERRLDGLRAEIELDLAELEDPDDPAAERHRRNLADLEALRAYALPLLAELDAFPQEGTWGAWLEALSALATRALRHPDRVLATLSELRPMAAVGPVSLREVVLVLERRLLELALPAEKSRYGKVTVAPCEAARGLAFDVVCVPGLAEKLFPKQISEDPILLDEQRTALALGLRTNRDRRDRERLALRLAVGAARTELFLSYPRLDLEKSRPRVPSFYGLEALGAAEGRIVGFDEFEARAERATDVRVGWPAPKTPAEAIDDAEYDVALLEQLMQPGSDAGKGAARYLLDANPHLGRALRFRARRWRPAWSGADGLLETKVPVSPGAREALAPQQLSQRSYSPTALQNYAACPYKFYLYALCRLSPREVPEAIDELDPLRRGSLVHDVQYRLFHRLQAEDLLPVRPGHLDRAREILDEVISDEAARARDELAPAIERVWEDGVSAIRADLREWLRRASEDESGWVPAHFELSFGLPGRRQRDASSVPEPVPLDCGIALRGSIDLVERGPAGRVRATDHKTGRARVKPGAVVDGGNSLQPVFYALAAEKIFGSEVDSGRLYYCTSAGGFAEVEVPLGKDARDAAGVVAEAIDRALSTPFLPANPADGACRWCDYRDVCGPYEESRVRRKYASQPELEPLARLRELP